MALQCLFYLSLGAWTALFVGAFAPRLGLSVLLDAKVSSHKWGCLHRVCVAHGPCCLVEWTALFAVPVMRETIAFTWHPKQSYSLANVQALHPALHSNQWTSSCSLSSHSHTGSTFFVRGCCSTPVVALHFSWYTCGVRLSCTCTECVQLPWLALLAKPVTQTACYQNDAA